MKKIIAILTLLPLMAFAADSVEITSIQTSATGNVEVSGSSIYDTVITTEGSFDGNSAGTNDLTNWTFSTKLKSGQHSFQATVGGTSATQSFSVPSNEGGLRACQFDGTCPTFGLSAPTIPNQNPTPATQNNRAKDGTLVTIQNLFQLLSAGLL